jgi:type I restriction enzyme M protein
MRRDVDRLCHVADASEVERNGFNLNIPRYVDRYVEPEIPDMASILTDLTDIDREIGKTERDLLSQIRRLVGTTEETRGEVRILQDLMTEYVETKGGQLAWQI